MAQGAALLRGLGVHAPTVFCSLGICLQTQVQDAVASPPRLCSSRLRKRTRALRGGRGSNRRRRSHSPGPEEECFDGNGGGGRESGNGGGGSDWWGGSWSWSWSDEEGSRKAILGVILSFFHQVACWVFLIQCLHFLVKSVIRLSQAPDDPAEDTAPAASFST